MINYYINPFPVSAYIKGKIKYILIKFIRIKENSITIFAKKFRKFINKIKNHFIK
jgi:hypothetical protein